MSLSFNSYLSIYLSNCLSTSFYSYLDHSLHTYLSIYQTVYLSQFYFAQSGGNVRYTKCMGSTPSLLLLLGSHWPTVVAPMKVLFMGQIELASWVWYLSTDDHEASVLEVWGMWSIPSLPVPLWPWMAVPVSVLSIGQIEPFNHLLYLKPLTLCKQIIDVY